ncbi:MAG: hypothetical protein KAT58_02745 [candidate division Zixibacteria bacterium]|nr:hypothetical protein [candidate division Zixibacteria bacterium]
MTAPTCPLCHGKGYTKSPYIMGTKDGDIYSYNTCSCPAGKLWAQQVEVRQEKEDDDEQ